MRGLRSTVAAEIERVRALRPFGSIEELARRVPSLFQADLPTLAETGALNSLGEKVHRRDALWQVERAGRQAGPLFSELDGDEEQLSPLERMNPEECMIADYAGTGVTVGRHPMAHCRDRLRSMNVFSAGDLKLMRHGVKARIAGQVIARQRPGTAHGFIFLSIEDETGIANAIIGPNRCDLRREPCRLSREGLTTAFRKMTYSLGVLPETPTLLLFLEVSSQSTGSYRGWASPRSQVPLNSALTPNN